MAITYVNDLRLSEMDTGDNSGTWGTVTNTNLELIGEALGFGTEAITTNADTHTSTIADGSTDPVRAMYVKYTGTLDSACTITIGPNTVNKFYYIENATSGSQNIIISQGSGANVTIPAGDTKAVYLDGAGSGAAVTDAFASLNVVDLKVQDLLTVTGGALLNGTTPTLTIGDAGAEDAKIVFDGNAADYHVGLDDSEDALQIGLGSALGTTPRVTIRSSEVVVNDLAADLDFRVESSNHDYALFVDGASGGVQMGDSDQLTVGTPGHGRLALVRTNGSTQLNMFRADGSISGGDTLGLITAYSNDTDGNSIEPLVQISMAADGAFSANDNPTKMVFSTTPDASETMREVGQFDNTGKFIGNYGAEFNSTSNGSGDFQVKSENKTHMLFVDASTDRVGINSSSPSTMLQLEAANNASDVNNALRFKDTDTSVVADQKIGRIEFETADSSNAGVNVQIDAIYGGSGAGSELVIKTGVAGSLENRLFIQDSETVFNEDGGDNNFRVEGASSHTHGLFYDAGLNQTFLGGATSPAATGFLSLGGIKFSNGAASGGAFLSWDNEGSSSEQSLIGYWYDGSSYRNRFRVAGNTAETTVNGSGEDIDFRVASDDKSDMLLIDANDNAVTVNGGVTSSYFSVGSDGTTTANEGLFNVTRGHGIRNTRMSGSSDSTNRTVTIVISDTGLRHVEVHIYASGNKYNSGTQNFAIKMVYVIMEESGSMRHNSDQTTELGYRLGNQESKVSAVTFSSTGGGNLTGTFTVGGEYDTGISIHAMGPGMTSITSLTFS